MMLGASAILLPLAAAVRSYAKQGSELKEMSERTGIAVESLSAFEYVASQTGTTMETLEKGVRLSQKAIGTLAGQKALKGFGIDLEKLKNLSPEDQFIALADYIGRIPVQADRAAAAMKIFGKGGADLLPLMNEGAGGVRKLMDEAARLGLVMSTADANAADEFGDSMDAVGLQIKRMVGNIGGALAPVIQQFAAKLSSIIPKVSEWVKQNQIVIVTVAKLAGYLLMFGAAFMVVSSGANMLASVFGLIRTIAIPLFAGLMVAVKAIAAGFMGLVAAIAMNPFVALAVVGGIAIIGLLAHFTNFFETLKGYFSDIGNIWSDTLGGMATALKAGDFKLAGEIFWVGFKLAWFEGIREVERAWFSMIDGLAKAWYRLVSLLPPVAVAQLVGKLPTYKDFSTAIDENSSSRTGEQDQRISELRKQLAEKRQKAIDENAPKTNITVEVTGNRPDIQGSGIQKQDSVAGAFYANQMLSLSAGDVSSAYAKRTADATERIADAVEEIGASESGFYGG